jgi:hypothetical protein
MQFHPKDLAQIKDHDLSVQKIEQDLHHFKTGFPNLEIVKPATLDDGIIRLNTEEKSELMETYQKADYEVLKFVPASGAASRMFRVLHQFIEEFPSAHLSYKEFISQDQFKTLEDFFNSIEQLSFYEHLALALRGKGIDIDSLTQDQKMLQLSRQMLATECFNMGDLPKGLIPFHKYRDGKLTAFEEHFYEALSYAVKKNTARLHFTISEGHLNKFKQKLKEFQPTIEQETGVKFEVSFSFQHPSTDTICLDSKGEIYRNEDGEILFRPAGHGALIENLNGLDADLVFIKNIDNVSHQKTALETNQSSLEYKSVLAGLLIQLQQKSFSFLSNLDKHPADRDLLEEAVSFLRKDLNILLDIETKEEVVHYLNRPIRVCGMVINEGAPGGGPFWIKNNDGSISLQIVEKSQIDLSQEDQIKKMEASTHFNPVDIVCSLKNYRGETFDLKQFVDTNKGFIAKKFVGGEAIKALELPGLWNGGMAFWNTVFVEVPAESFNPVKTVADLLKPGHQPRSDV